MQRSMKGAWAGGVAAALLCVGAASRQGGAVPETEAYTGRVTQWHLADDGSVYVRVAVESDREYWFRSPVEQTTTTDFEAMLMSVVIAMRDESSSLREITVYAEPSSETEREAGRTLEQARRIVAVSGD